MTTTYRTRYHRDGSVTYWDVYAQQWSRQPAERISDAVLASLSETERRRIARMALRGAGGRS